MARRNSLKNKFDDMSLDEPLKVEIDGRELELEVFAEDVSTFMLIGQQDDEVEQRHLDSLEDTLRKILQRSYLPYYDDVRGQEPANLNDSQQQENEKAKEFINGLLVRKLPQLINKMVTELGWNQGVDVDNGDFPGNPQQ